MNNSGTYLIRQLSLINALLFTILLYSLLLSADNLSKGGGIKKNWHFLHLSFYLHACFVLFLCLFDLILYVPSTISQL